MGKVMGDLSGRRGRIVTMDADGALQVIKAQAPARELYKYASELRSLTGGRGIHSEEFSHYEQLPLDLEKKVIEEAAKSRGNHQAAH
jgi:elongation factor G